MENNKPEVSNCPICNAEIQKNPRYEKEVCRACRYKVTDKTRRELLLYDDSAIYKDDDSDYKSNLCYINGVECFFYARHFGGVVVETRSGQKMDLRVNGDRK